MTSAAMAFSLKNVRPMTSSCDSSTDKFCDCGSSRPVATAVPVGKVRRLHGHRKHLRPEKNYDRSAAGRNPHHTNVYTTSSNQPTIAPASGEKSNGRSLHIGGQVAAPSRVTNGAAIVDHYNDLTETILQGVRISCFVSGGEKRLCLPEVMSTALQHVPLIDIERACNRLKIHNQHCSPAQVYVLQLNKVLPPTTTTCGLITQANAERLCHYLLYTRRNRGKLPLDTAVEGRPLRVEDDSGSDVMSQPSSCKSAPGMTTSQNDMKQTRVPVVHNCSGCVQGTAFVSLYKSPNSACIQCGQCCLLFSPPDFVCHGHRELVCQPETISVGPHVCHWGLDSNKWRLYLNVDRNALCKMDKECFQEGKLARKADEQSLIDKLTIKSWEKQLSEFKRMFPDIYKGSTSVAINHGAHPLPPNKLKAQPGQPLNMPNLLFAPPPSETKFRQHNTMAFRDQAASYSPLAATTMALTNPGAVAMEIGFDSLIRIAKTMAASEDLVQNTMVDEIVKLRLICQHSTSFLFQTNSLLSHSVDQLARENFALKRDYEQLAESCVLKTTDGGAQSQCNCSQPTRRKLATLSDPAEQTNVATIAVDRIDHNLSE